MGNETGLPQTGSQIDDDYLTVAMLSAGLAYMLRRRANTAMPDPEGGLLPTPWRMAFTRLWWRCHQQGVAPIESDLDLLGYCARPLADWPVALSLSETDIQSPLIAEDELSAFGEQCARIATTDVEAEWQEKKIYAAIVAAAEANGGGDDAKTDLVYATIRRRLIDFPVVSDRDVQRWEQEFSETDGSGQTYLRHVVNAAYVARTMPGTHSYLRCPDCRNPVEGFGAVCGTPGCAGGPPEKASTRCLAVVHEQHRATRRFMHDPGLVEARLFDALRSDELAGKVRITAYPSLDALDILIEFLEGEGDSAVVRETWGADAKDQASATMLGRAFTWPDRPACDRRLLVLPMHRKHQHDYVGDLVAELEGRVNGVEVIDEKRLISEVKKNVWSAER